MKGEFLIAGLIRYLSAIAALLLLISAASCTGSSGTPAESSVGLAPAFASYQLPTPVQLRNISGLLESGSFKFGMEFQTEWPRFGAEPAEVGSSLFMSNGGAEPVTRYCFAGYSLGVPLGDFDNTLRLEKPASWEAGTFWVGLANFSANRWDWQVVDGYAAVVDPARHLEDNTAFVYLVYTGDGVQEIESIRLGALAPPFVRNVSPSIGTAGADVVFGARLLESDKFADQPYYADQWHWEFGSAASPAVSYSENPQVTLAPPGDYVCRLTATNPAGTVEHQFHLVAIPRKETATVGERVRVRIVTGELSPYEPLSSLSGVGVSVPEGAAYVPGSFNVGSIGGDAYNTDGLWSVMNPPISDFLVVPDDWFDAIPTDVPGQLLLPFSVAPIQGRDITAPGVLFNFELVFDSPGVYPLGFVDVYQGERTHFTEESGRRNYWYDISNDHAGYANTVTVTE
jgi:hypothetical protein